MKFPLNFFLALWLIAPTSYAIDLPVQMYGSSDASIRVSYFWSSRCIKSPLAFKNIVANLIEYANQGKIRLSVFYLSRNQADFEENGPIFMCVPVERRKDYFAKHQSLAANGALDTTSANDALLLANQFGVTAKTVSQCATEETLASLALIRKFADDQLDWNATPYFVVNGKKLGDLAFLWQFEDALEELGLSLK